MFSRHKSTKETVKTIVWGMPGVSRCDRGDYLACFLHCTRDCGCIERPAFPAPSIFLGRKFLQDSDECCRENKKPYLFVVARLDVRSGQMNARSSAPGRR